MATFGPVDTWLRAGRKGDWRRAVLARLLNYYRKHSAIFYSVQSPADAERLRSTGTPWPGEARRAALGEGVYPWDNRDSARRYLRSLEQHWGIAHLTILAFRVFRPTLRLFRKLIVDNLPDPEAWLARYSRLWGGTPNHGLEYIQRGTGQFGTEHFFAKSVYRHLRFR